MGDIKENLANLGLNSKETSIYLTLIRFGTQAAANLARKTGYPKSTVLFICDNLTARGLLQKTKRGKVQFYHAAIEDLTRKTNEIILSQQKALDLAQEQLTKLANPYTKEPAVSFYEGKESCRNAYRKLLDSRSEILEFGKHSDLQEKLGAEFMQTFITERTQRVLAVRSISGLPDIDFDLNRKDSAELRRQKSFSEDLGRVYSSIAIYDQKILILNLHTQSFGILIDSFEVSQTLRTIFELCWSKLEPGEFQCPKT